MPENPLLLLKIVPEVGLEIPQAGVQGDQEDKRKGAERQLHDTTSPAGIPRAKGTRLDPRRHAAARPHLLPRGVENASLNRGVRALGALDRQN
jgi:hypothetical protein